MPRIFDVVRVFDTELMRMRGSTDEYLFRIEILKERGTESYSAKIWNQECYEVQPSYPAQPNGTPKTNAISRRLLVEEEELSWQVEGSSLEDVLAQVMARLDERFEVY